MYICSSDLPYRAHVGNDTAPLLNNCLPQTEEGKHAVQIAERLRVSSTVEPADITLISLAAAAHPDALNGLVLLWVDDGGESLTAFDPGTPGLWHEDPQQLSNNSRPTAVLRFTDGHYEAVVDSKFITIDGDETFYKALLTAVHQRGEGIVTTAEGEQLRQSLASFMQTEADRLGLLWQGKNQGLPTWETTELTDTDNNPPWGIFDRHPKLAECGNFPLVSLLKDKGKVVDSLAHLFLNNQTGLITNPSQLTVEQNISRQMFPAQVEEMASRFGTVKNGKVAHDYATLPLITTIAASVVVKPAGGSKTILTAMGALGLTGLIVASKQLISWYHGPNKRDIPASQQLPIDTALSLPHSADPAYPDIQLENTDDDFFISSDETHVTSPMSDEEKIASRLAQFAAPEAIFLPTIRTTTPRETDDVRVEQFDLSCVEKRQSLSIADVLRQIGDTLSYPVAELTKEAQVISYYERYKQCPTEKEIEQLESVTMRIDDFISSFISFLPYSTPIVLIQRVGGPLFQLFADAMENKDLDINNVSAINDQVMFLARTTWEFTPRERHGEVNMEKIKLPGKTTFKDNKLSAIINNDFFNLNREGEHYIGRSSHSTRHIKYSPSQHAWVFSEDRAYLYEENYHKAMVNKYRVDHNYLLRIKKHPNSRQGIAIDNNNNIMHISKSDGNYAKFILMDNGRGKFNVESDFYRINGVDYGYAKKSGMENKLVRFNRNGFFFEARSTKINDNLAELIDNGTLRNTPSENFHVSSIMKDGFSYDDKNHKYLKYNNGYYKIETDEYNCEYITCLKNDKPDRVYIKKNEEGFFDVDNEFSWAKMEQRFVKTTEDYFIDKEIVHDINKNCVSYDGAVNHRAEKGVFRNDDSDFYFSLNGKLYELVKYNRDSIVIKSKYSEVDYISLYMINDYFFENKNNDQVEERDFLEITPSSCKIKRSPMTASCDAVVISPGADRLLRAKVKKGVVELDVAEEKLRLMTVFPNLFFDSQNKKMYFKYGGYFYSAKFINGTELNLLKQATLHVYYKDIFGGRHNIVSLVFDKINGKGIIQTQEEKLQWRADMTARESIDFIQDNNFLNIPNFAKLEDVVADVNSKNSIKFVTLSNKYQQGDIRASIKFFLNYDDDNFDIHSMNDISDTAPFYLRGGALLVDNSIKYANQQIDVAVRELNNFTPNAQKYIGYVLDVEDPGAIRDFSNQLVNKLTRIKGKINKENIRLISKNREVMPSEFFEKDTVRDSDTLLNPPVNENYYHRAAMSESERRNGILAMVPLDFKRNIYVCLDRLYFIDLTHPDTTLRKEPVTDITETIIHEAMHSAGIDTDMTYISTENGKVIPVLDAIDEYRGNILLNRLNDKETFIKMQQEYMKLHPEYSTVTETMRDDNNALDYLFTHDIGFKANVLLATPDFFPVFVRDLSANAPVKLRAG